MKTPREILFQRYQAAVPKLDAVRQSVVAAAYGRRASSDQTHERASRPAVTMICDALWRELVFPCRHIWTALAAVWALLVVINISQRDAVSSVTGKPVRSPMVMMSWQVQQRWMNDLLADRSPVPVTDRPRNVAPKPHTQNCETSAV